MQDREWTALVEIEWNVTPAGIWFLVAPLMPAGVALKIETKGSWTLAGAVLTPDGYPAGTSPSLDGYNQDIAPGAVMAKLGGSSAGLKDGTVFPIGSFCITVIDATAKSGPLFLAVNVAAKHLAGAAGKLTSSISVGRA